MSLSKVSTAAKLVLTDLAKLEIPTIATAVAGVVAPIVLSLFGVDFAPAVIAGWLTLAGSVAAMLQKIASGQTTPPTPPSPTPPVPGPVPPTPPVPVPPVPPAPPAPVVPRAKGSKSNPKRP